MTAPETPAPVPPTGAGQRVPCHVHGCVDHIEGHHVDRLGDAILHVGCDACAAASWEALRDEFMAALRRCPCVVRPYPYGDKHRDECPRKGTIGARVDAIRPIVERVAVDARREALGPILALHQPLTYEVQGAIFGTTVMVNCRDFPGCDGSADEPCEEGDLIGGHEVPACRECGGANEDGEGYSEPHPCQTRRIALEALEAQR